MVSKSKKLKNSKKSTTVLYKNNVTILYQDAKGKYRLLSKHNNTGDGLLFLIAKAAQGIFDSNLVPRYLGAQYLDEETKTLKPAFLQLVERSKAPVLYSSEDSTGQTLHSVPDTVEYSFVIPAGTIFTDTNVKKFCLYNNYVNSDNMGEMHPQALCAELDVEDQSLNNQDTGNLIVYWRIAFSDVVELEEDVE